MLGLFFDEIAAGLAVELGSYHFTRDNVLAFARQFDPQPFHVDDEAAAQGPFGKLAASGWHTAAGWMKCFVASNDAACTKLKAQGKTLPEVGPGAGFTKLKWIRPVFPGDTVSYRTAVTSKRELSTRPKWGIVESINEGFNQSGELVYSFEGKVLVARRENVNAPQTPPAYAPSRPWS